MGKRSDFLRRERDCYDTPESAVLPLLPHLVTAYRFRYWEPCAGANKLVESLERHTFSARCVQASDIQPRHQDIDEYDALAVPWSEIIDHDFIITNPPWYRPVLHAMIERFSSKKPTWLLLDADWAHTKQAAPYMALCVKIVSVGRVSWMENGTSGKDNCAWFLFDAQHDGGTQFFARAA